MKHYIAKFYFDDEPGDQMIKHVLVCDRCGKEYGNPPDCEDYIYPPGSGEAILYAEDNVDNVAKHWELCRDCTTELTTWLNPEPRVRGQQWGLREAPPAAIGAGYALTIYTLVEPGGREGDWWADDRSGDRKLLPREWFVSGKLRRP